jgi:hypothetical protein
LSCLQTSFAWEQESFDLKLFFLSEEMTPWKNQTICLLYYRHLFTVACYRLPHPTNIATDKFDHRSCLNGLPVCKCGHY